MLALMIAGLVAQEAAVTPAEEGQGIVTAQVVVAVGASGTEEYGQVFATAADLWTRAANRGGAALTLLNGKNSDKPDRDALKEIVSAESDAPLWLILIGHGTFDQRSARFNLNGPDVSAKELSEWLGNTERRVAVINCTSASAPFINRLSGKNRVIVTATKSGHEHNYARFGVYLAEVIGDPAVDLDKDGQTSLLEAWLVAARRTQDFYRENGRLATEHALIDDNGDERGTRYDAFRGIRPIARADGGALDGYRAHQWHLVPGKLERSMPAALVAERDELELAVRRLREHRSDFREEDYYRELEQLLIPLATLYEEVERSAAESAR